MAKRTDAPGKLELVRAFVNSADLEEGTDDIATADSLAAWLAARELLRARETAAGKRDVARAREVREALREVLLAHGSDEAPDPAAPAVLDAASRRADLGVRFTADGTAAVEPAARGVDGALGRILAIVAAAMADGTWYRMKACREDSCRWAFYDHTKNHSGRWCQMAECGNRAKARAYRRRHSASGAPK